MAFGLKIINGDFHISENGSVLTVSDGEKCLRDFGKMLNTDAENTQNMTEYYRYNPSYGSLLGNTQFYSGLSRATVLDVINELTYNTIKNYLALQESRDNLDLGEVIIDCRYDTYFDTDNPALVIIPIKITNGQGLSYNLGEFEERVV